VSLVERGDDSIQLLATGCAENGRPVQSRYTSPQQAAETRGISRLVQLPDYIEVTQSTSFDSFLCILDNRVANVRPDTKAPYFLETKENATYLQDDTSKDVFLRFVNDPEVGSFFWLSRWRLHSSLASSWE
jgi:hypothetical protein